MPYNATAVGSPTYTTSGVPAAFDHAAVLNGGSQYFTASVTPFQFGAAASFTAECRVLFTSASSGPFIAMGVNSTNAPNRWFLAVSSKNAYAQVGATVIAAGPNINDGAWHTIALVVDTGTKMYLFVDGVLVASNLAMSWAGTDGSGTAYLGGWSASADYWPAGQLDELALNNSALYTATYTPATVEFAAGRSGQLALWHMDNNANDSNTNAIPPTIGTISIASAAGTDTITYPMPVAGGNPVAGCALYVGNTTGGESGTPYTTTSGTSGGTFTHPSPPAGQTYFYEVKAYDNGTPTYSAASNEVSSVTPLPTNDASLLYSPFNWVVGAGSAQSVNPGAYLRQFFSGTTLTLTFDVSNCTSPFPVLKIRIDGANWTQYTVASTIALTGLANREHLLELVIMTTTQSQERWTSPVALVKLTGLSYDGGAVLSAPVARSKNILVFGDSITEGYGTIGAAADSTLDYSYNLSLALDCEVGVVGFGGTGLTTTASGATGDVPNLQSSYATIFTGNARSFSAPAPDLVLYLEGHNDNASSDAAVTAALVAVLSAIAAAAPGARQLVLSPLSQNKAAALAAGVTALASAAVTYQSTNGWIVIPGDTVDGVHPYAYAHLGKILPHAANLAAAQLGPAGTAGGAGMIRVGHSY